MQRISSQPLGRFIAAALLGIGLSSCGGSDAELSEARRLVQRGELEAAQAALVGAESASARSLRAEITEQLVARRALDNAIAELSELDPREAIERLNKWLKRETDPRSVERLEFELSDAVDRAASLGSSNRLTRREQDERAAQRRGARTRAEAEATAAAVAAAEEQQRKAPPTEPPAPATEDTVVVDVPADKGAAPDDGAETSVRVEEIEPEEASASQAALVPPVEEERTIVRPIDILRPELEAAEKTLTRAKDTTRQEAYSALEDYDELALPFIERALRARWEKATESAVKHPAVRSLEKLTQDREELDFRRKLALELIFDEVEYFYPYRPPECPQEKAKEYGAVQRRVDQLVADVRDAWDVPRSVKLPGSFHDLFDELRWLRERAREQSIALALPEVLPERLFVLSPTQPSVDIRSFAWDQEEAAHLLKAETIVAYNLRAWSKGKQEPLTSEQQAERGEQEQVQITNAYRRMFGRQALAWNPLLQAAADGHSDYMANTGHFGHYEDGDPSRRSPFDRMSLEGYTRGVSENCAMGTGSAQGAHDGWSRSSGHHRNLLMPGHKEMGSAVGGSFWTQNFGNDKAFENELDSWQD